LITFAASVAAKADPITLTLTSLTANGQAVVINGTPQAIDGFNVKAMPNGMNGVSTLFPDAVGVLWGSQLQPFAGSNAVLNLVGLMNICIGTSCASNVLFSGQIANSLAGAYWSMPPSASMVATQDGNRISLSYLTNVPGGNGRTFSSTIDVAANGKLIGLIDPPKPIPEPATLCLVGSALAGLAARMRRKKNAVDA
jgi:PEP-CTERM motif